MNRMAIVPKEALELQGGAARGASRDDARLVAALRAGDDDAFASLVTDYQTAIYNLAWRLVDDREDARDIAQEVFLKAYRQIPKIEGELHLWAWLYRVTVNACWEHLRARSRRPVSVGDRPEEADLGTRDGEDQAELARLFTASLAKLSPKQQVALLLKDVHGLPHSDIAATLGISRGSSEVLLFRARRSFRSAFTSMTADVPREPACRFAEQAAAYSVGGRLTRARRRRVLEHARTCQACRNTVERWSGGRAAGLGLALPLVAAPELFGAHVTASATTNLAASAGATAATSAGATAATSAGASSLASAAAAAGTSTVASASASAAASAGASTIAGGLAAKIAGLGVAKAAVVVLVATTAVTYGGATASKDHAREGGRRAADAPAAAARAHVGASGSHGSSAAHPVADAAAKSGHSTVARDRRHVGKPGARRVRARGSQRAGGLLAGDAGLGHGVRRTDKATSRPAKLGQALLARPSNAGRPGARLEKAPASGARAAAKPRPPRVGHHQPGPPPRPPRGGSHKPLVSQ